MGRRKARGTARSPEAQQAKAAFNAKFEEYKAAIRDIEKIQAEFQTADAPTRKKLNEQLTGHIAQTQAVVNAMVEAAEAAYRAAPNADPQVTEVLHSGRKALHHRPANRAGAAVALDPSDVYYPIDGGDQYERGLPIVKLLIDGKDPNAELYVWGFLCAYMTNDYDLAETYLNKAKETGAIDAIDLAATHDDARTRKRE